MKRTLLALMTMLCLVFCCSNPITVRANSDVSKHVCAYTPMYGKPAGNWTERCHVTPNTCTVSVSMYEVTEVCACGQTRVTSQREEHHTTESHNH